MHTNTTGIRKTKKNKKKNLFMNCLLISTSTCISPVLHTTRTKYGAELKKFQFFFFFIFFSDRFFSCLNLGAAEKAKKAIENGIAHSLSHLSS